MKQRRYTWRYLLADGSYRSGHVWAYNKSDAAAAASLAFAAVTTEEQRRGAWAVGVELER